MPHGQERDRVKELSYDYVSDEEDSTGKWVVRKPTWRSQEADRLMRALQDTLEHTREEDIRPRIPRMEGPPSLRSIPRCQVSWAIQEQHSAQDQFFKVKRICQVSDSDSDDCY